jgi:hypothetical protein
MYRVPPKEASCKVSELKSITSFPNLPNLINGLAVGELGFRILGTISTQNDAHDIATIALNNAFPNYAPRNFTNAFQVPSKTAILAPRKVNEKIEDWFRKISPEIFEQCVERPMVQRVDAGEACMIK